MIIGAYVLFATVIITVPSEVQESSQFHSLGLTSTKTTHAEDYGEATHFDEDIVVYDAISQ